ncbi:hypothetical protein ASC77_08710 [Nocardioides sp. Root1257]|uniref:hypothetical protein n=1 Tax=unclassified Nocardioides TaxID=2615069 RepID=UPI0006F82109|nr:MULTISPECIES: hypothetical protein [unclassified Nocardioides]KQW48803.1 hypothetical protein ASC77_08710 [Nocardioides sp. Root1257]KRC47978.1 hypothetical protein ASE24_08715 [Nocardioides sp. Root224]
MTRVRLAVVLGTLAVLAVVATATVAVVTATGDDREGGEHSAAVPLDVTDPGTGATFSVPAQDWEVRGPRSRIFYEDDDGRRTAVVTGPAVYRDGYCAAQPGDSNRGFAGFTGQSFDTWVAAVRGGRAAMSTGTTRQRLELADGSTASLSWVSLLVSGDGACSAGAVEVAMLRSGDVRVVLVADAEEEGTLAHEEIVRILSGLRP